MNRLLLDTHILLWALLSPDYLAKNIAEALENPGNELWLSPITTWEIIVLAEKGRIELATAPSQWMKDVLGTLPFREAALNHAVAIESQHIQLRHQDPADRFIAATAVVYDLTLVTADRNLIETPGGFSVLPNQ